jgi:hypothetical protein
MTTSPLLRRADALLRGLPEPAATATAAWISRLAIVVVFGALYGATMGSYGERPLQAAYSALKLPLMLAATFAISLPPFFVANTLFGLRDDFPRVVGALATAQAGLTVILASLAPVTAFAYHACGLDHRPAVLLNGLMFALASLGAQVVLRRSYRELVAARPAHRVMLRAWLGVYVFVGIQMGWVLRPFIGAPGMATQFFREDSWTNAYVVVWNMVAAVLSGT